MAGAEQFRRVDAVKLESIVGGIYGRLGIPEPDARLLARALVDADLRGVHSHGCRYVSAYAKSIREGRVNLHPNVHIVSDGPNDGPTITVDGDRGLGHLVAYRAMEMAIERSKKHGS